MFSGPPPQAPPPPCTTGVGATVSATVALGNSSLEGIHGGHLVILPNSVASDLHMRLTPPGLWPLELPKTEDFKARPCLHPMNFFILHFHLSCPLLPPPPSSALQSDADASEEQLRVYREAHSELLQSYPSSAVVNSRPFKKAKHSHAIVGDMAIGDFHAQHLVVGASTASDHPELADLPAPAKAPTRYQSDCMPPSLLTLFAL